MLLDFLDNSEYLDRDQPKVPRDRHRRASTG